MAQGLVGANVQQLKDLSVQMRAAAANIAAIEGRLSSVVSGARWTGPSARRFISDWGSVHRIGMRNASGLLQSRGVELAKQAAEQEAVSSAGSAGAGTTPGNGLAPLPSGIDAQLQFALTKLDPYQRAEWWQGLSAQDRYDLILKYPETIGNLPGVSYADRNTANRITLYREIDAAKASGDEGLLEYLTSVKKAINDKSDPPYQLMSLTTNTPPGASISVGDLDKAEYATFLIPGMGSDSAGTVTGMAKSSLDLYKEEHRLAVANGLSTDIAVVAFMEYDSPEMIVDGWKVDFDVLGEDKARAGGALLREELIGYDAVLNAQPGRDSSSSFLGVDAHSYGSTTLAYAIDGMPKGVVDTVYSAGSAGIPRDLENPYGSSVPNGQVFAVHGEEFTAGPGQFFGGRKDPMGMSGVTPLSSGNTVVDGVNYHGTTEHGMNNGKAAGYGYFEEDTMALHNSALVNLGLGDDAIPEPPPVLTSGRWPVGTL